MAPFVGTQFYTIWSILLTGVSISCRTDNPKQFGKKGLLSASKEFLSSMSMEVFDGLNGVEDAISDANERYRTYFNSISMYISARNAGCDYLFQGSHYLRMVAYNIANGGEERFKEYNSKGKPMFVKCKLLLSSLPNSEYAKSSSAPNLLYLGAIIRRYIHFIAKSNLEYEEWPESLSVYESIPPADILAILDANVCLEWKRRNGTNPAQ